VLRNVTVWLWVMVQVSKGHTGVRASLPGANAR